MFPSILFENNQIDYSFLSIEFQENHLIVYRLNEYWSLIFFNRLILSSVYIDMNKNQRVPEICFASAFFISWCLIISQVFDFIMRVLFLNC